MNSKEFTQAISELKDCHKLTPTERAYLKDIHAQIAEHEQTIKESRKRIEDIKATAYYRVSGRMLDSEEAEVSKLKESIRLAEIAVKHLNAAKPYYADEYQSLVSQKEKALAVYLRAVDAFRQADDAVQTARKGYIFDEIIEAEKAALIAKQTVEAAEAGYNEACKLVSEYQPAWEKVADNIRDQITETAAAEVFKLFSKVAEVLETGLKQMDTLHTEESKFNISNKDNTELQYHFDCHWMLLLQNEITDYLKKADR